jgi:DNA polymerase-3 subunit alpha
LLKIAEGLDLKLTVGTDAHYLTKEDRYVHKAYLNSKGGEREVDDFYEFTYIMTPDELRKLLRLSFNDDDIIENIFLTSIEL